MSFTKVELPTQNYTRISINPYFDPSVENMGLEKYNLSLYEGVEHEEQLACLEINGITRYITGLDEFAPEVKNLPEEQRIAKVKQIRQIVSQLEKELSSNTVDVDDKEFWNKVTLLKPNNKQFWNEITLRVGNNPVYLDPKTNSYDLIKLCAIEAGGFSMVAASLDSAKKMAKPPKFYLNKLEDTLILKNEYKKIKNKALAKLQTLSENNVVKLFYIAKSLDGAALQYTKSTPDELIYDAMDKYINAQGIERVKKRAAENFINLTKLSLEDLIIKALIKDASYHKYIVLKADGFIYDQASSTLLGNNPEDVFEYFKNPLNDALFTDIKSKVDSYWETKQ